MRDVDALLLKLFKEGPASISMTEVWAAIANDEENDREKDQRLENLEALVELWARERSQFREQVIQQSQGEA